MMRNSLMILVSMATRGHNEILAYAATRAVPKVIRAGELPLIPADGTIGWPNQSNAGELALVVWCRRIIGI